MDKKLETPLDGGSVRARCGPGGSPGASPRQRREGLGGGRGGARGRDAGTFTVDRPTALNGQVGRTCAKTEARR